jgi:hypothetical protein
MNSLFDKKPLVWFITGTSQGFGRAADAIVQAVTSEDPPLHLPLGAFAFERACQKFDEMRVEFGKWREVALAIDFRGLNIQKLSALT